jgi:hypothetical protein
VNQARRPGSLWLSGFGVLTSKSPAWAFRKYSRTILSDVLEPTGFVKIDDQVRLFGLEISGRIIKREMAVLTNTNEGNIDGRRDHGFACAPDRR